MDKKEPEKFAKEQGFSSIDDFVKANLHYLPAEKQKLFYSICGKRNDPDGYSGGYGGKG